MTAWAVSKKPAKKAMIVGDIPRIYIWLGPPVAFWLLVLWWATR